MKDPVKTVAEKQFSVINKKKILFLHNNARLHIARMTIYKLQKLEFETLLYPLHSPNFSPTAIRLNISISF